MEKWLFTILLSLIILVAAFNIVSSQIMIVLEKRREIGILKAIGASREGIMKIFLYEGMIVGVVGTFLGLIVGYGVCWGQQTFEWLSLPGDVYFLSTLPVQMQILDFIVITIVSLGLAILASVYPARRASALDPVEAIRYE
ncbi:MAG: ABC transporter permease [Calditrichaeota bacterium]|nr:ABC transporter permease [Calditrichota bacterium]